MLSLGFGGLLICIVGAAAGTFLVLSRVRWDEAQTRKTFLERETHAALDSYARSLEAEEREPFRALRSETEAYWRVLDRTLSWPPEERNRLRYSFFYNELVPRRTAMLQIADRIATVNERGLNRSEERLAASSVGLRRWILEL